VLAAGYAQMALHEMAKFTPQELPYPEGSYGEVFGIREKLNPVTRRVDDPFERE
jgi:hypothetical protein